MSDHEPKPLALFSELPYYLPSSSNSANVVPHYNHTQLGSPQRLPGRDTKTSGEVDHRRFVTSHPREHYRFQLLGMGSPAWRRLTPRHGQHINSIDGRQLPSQIAKVPTRSG